MQLATNLPRLISQRGPADLATGLPHSCHTHSSTEPGHESACGSGGPSHPSTWGTPAGRPADGRAALEVLTNSVGGLLGVGICIATRGPQAMQLSLAGAFLWWSAATWGHRQPASELPAGDHSATTKPGGYRPLLSRPGLFVLGLFVFLMMLVLGGLLELALEDVDSSPIYLAMEILAVAISMAMGAITLWIAATDSVRGGAR